MRLSMKALETLKSKKIVSTPSYDRAALKPGILHIGVGNFHRSHMAAYMDDLFNSDFENNKEWGIVGAGILWFDADKRKLLEPQDWMQILVERDATTEKPSVIGSMIDFLPVAVDPIQAALVGPQIKIVSLTVTEGGYYLNDGKLDINNPDIQHDIQNPDAPKTVFGIIIKALKQRKEASEIPFTVMSCDNIPHNGDVVKSVVLGLAKEIDTALAAWMEENVGFPNSMVDRITPAMTEEAKKFVLDKYELEDASPIMCEPFRQWVLEEKFSKGGRPSLENCENVKFVPDVTPYEFMKIRILNGGHASLCYPSALLGLDYVHQAMEHDTIGPFLDALERNEIIPTVPPVPDTVLLDYWKIIADRFTNPTLNDTIRRNCYDGASRQPKFVIPAIKDNLAAGKSVDGLALVSAMWCRYCQGLLESGEAIAANDPIWEKLQERALLAKTDPKLWLENAEVYGEVGTNPIFIEAFTKALNSIQSVGVDEAMKLYVASKQS